ncbi:polysaccharide biosynthesis protein [Patescibacteria group bacterium]|nr:polysaccharide biosynthesis protein [Patescibacteria group bacterium]
MKRYFKNKIILVTGGSGSIGSEIVKHLLKYNPKVIRVFSNDENAQFNLRQQLREYDNIRYLLGDVRDKDRLNRAISGVDILFHAAAFKHVPACEYNPFEAVQTNVIGTQNLIDAALNANIERFVTISTDKATNPINVLGATKLLAERLTISADYYKGHHKTIFCCVRFGNVLGSRGSVVEVFKEQIKRGGPLTITSSNMTRFIMNILRAVDLVLKATIHSIGGEIFILKMPAVRIDTLSKAMVEIYAPKHGYDPRKIKFKMSGVRSGEKFYEELMTEHEMEYLYETENMFVLVPPTIFPTYVKRYETTIKKCLNYKRILIPMYRSDKVHLLSINEIKKLLKGWEIVNV